MSTEATRRRTIILFTTNEAVNRLTVSLGGCVADALRMHVFRDPMHTTAMDV
jgi:hypothetical protein